MTAPPDAATDGPATDPPQVPGRAPRTGSGHRLHRDSAVIGLLTLLLGFAIAVQVRSNSSADSLVNARSGDLVAILDDQDNQQARLRTKIAQLQAALTKLENSGSDDAAARAQAQQQSDAIGILTGTLPATGPGLTLTITDPRSALRAADLLDVVEELRGAGAETIQFGAVRVGVSSSFVDGSDGIELDDAVLTRPFVVRAIGPAATMDTALNIPGGVAATARTAGGTATVVRGDRVDITATRTLPATKWVTPASR